MAMPPLSVTMSILLSVLLRVAHTISEPSSFLVFLQSATNKLPFQPESEWLDTWGKEASFVVNPKEPLVRKSKYRKCLASGCHIVLQFYSFRRWTQGSVPFVEANPLPTYQQSWCPLHPWHDKQRYCLRLWPQLWTGGLCWCIVCGYRGVKIDRIVHRLLWRITNIVAESTTVISGRTFNNHSWILCVGTGSTRIAVDSENCNCNRTTSSRAGDPALYRQSKCHYPGRETWHRQDDQMDRSTLLLREGCCPWQPGRYPIRFYRWQPCKWT